MRVVAQFAMVWRLEQPFASFPNFIWERTCGGNFIADPCMIHSERLERNKISPEQETFPSETWERGKNG